MQAAVRELTRLAHRLQFCKGGAPSPRGIALEHRLRRLGARCPREPEHRDERRCSGRDPQVSQFDSFLGGSEWRLLKAGELLRRRQTSRGDSARPHSRQADLAQLSDYGR